MVDMFSGKGLRTVQADNTVPRSCASPLSSNLDFVPPSSTSFVPVLHFLEEGGGAPKIPDAEATVAIDVHGGSLLGATWPLICSRAP